MGEFFPSEKNFGTVMCDCAFRNTTVRRGERLYIADARNKLLLYMKSNGLEPHTWVIGSVDVAQWTNFVTLAVRQYCIGTVRYCGATFAEVASLYCDDLINAKDRSCFFEKLSTKNRKRVLVQAGLSRGDACELLYGLVAGGRRFIT